MVPVRFFPILVAAALARAGNDEQDLNSTIEIEATPRLSVVMNVFALQRALALPPPRQRPPLRRLVTYYHGCYPGRYGNRRLNPDNPCLHRLGSLQKEPQHPDKTTLTTDNDQKSPKHSSSLGGKEAKSREQKPSQSGCCFECRWWCRCCVG